MADSKKLITPEYFEDPIGAYIICQSQEEIDSTLKHLHEMGFLWHTGDNLWPLVPESPKFSEPIKARTLRKKLPSMLELLSDCQAERDDEVIDTCVVAIGCTYVGADTKFIKGTVGYSRVYDYHTVSPWFLRSKRILYKNCKWPAPSQYCPAEALNYGNEN